MPLSSLLKGRLNIIAHAREEFERAAIIFQSIQCKSGGTFTPPGTVRLLVCIDGTSRHLDFKASEVEDCESLVAGEVWYKISEFIDGCKKQ
jgi:hypothetical protein